MELRRLPSSLGVVPGSDRVGILTHEELEDAPGGGCRPAAAGPTLFDDDRNHPLRITQRSRSHEPGGVDLLNLLGERLHDLGRSRLAANLLEGLALAVRLVVAEPGKGEA